MSVTGNGLFLWLRLKHRPVYGLLSTTSLLSPLQMGSLFAGLRQTVDIPAIGMLLGKSTQQLDYFLRSLHVCVSFLTPVAFLR